MKITIILVIVLMLLLIGCGKNASTNNHGFGYHYDSVGPSTGIQLRHFMGQPNPDILLVESIYIQTAQCMGLDATAYPPPLVVITDAPILRSDGTQASGGTYLDTGLITISHYADDIPTYQWVYKHEFVHFLLQDLGYPEALNRAHDSPYFDSCAPIFDPTPF